MTTDSHLPGLKAWMQNMRGDLPPEALAVMDAEKTLLQLDTGKICKPQAAQRFRILARTYDTAAPVLCNYLRAAATELDPQQQEKKQCPITSSTFRSRPSSL